MNDLDLKTTLGVPFPEILESLFRHQLLNHFSQAPLCFCAIQGCSMGVGRGAHALY